MKKYIVALKLVVKPKSWPENKKELWNGKRESVCLQGSEKGKTWKKAYYMTSAHGLHVPGPEVSPMSACASAYQHFAFSQCGP